MSISDKAKELAVSVMASREFSDLKQAKSVIDRNRELRSKIEDFRKKEEVLYSGRFSSDAAQQKADELKKIFDSLAKIPEVDRFLKAQKNFNTMVQNILKIINDTLESNLKS